MPPLVRNVRNDELVQLIDSQKNVDLIKTISVTNNAYYVLLYTSRQLNDTEKFCCSGRNPVRLAVDTTFNPCNLGLTNTSYKNKMILNESNGNNPVFFVLPMLHFTKDVESFSRISLELQAGNPKIKDLKSIGVDIEAAIFNGFKTYNPNLGSLICVRHLRKRDK